MEIRGAAHNKIRPISGSPKKSTQRGESTQRREGTQKNTVKKEGGGVTFIPGNYVGSFLLICLHK